MLLTFTVARHSGDIERVTLDRSLNSRLPSFIETGTPFNRFSTAAFIYQTAESCGIYSWAAFNQINTAYLLVSLYTP